MSATKIESWASTVRNFRRAQRLTQKEAARLLGVSQPTFSRWEAGRQVPDARTRARLRRRIEALSGLHRRLLVETVRRSPVPQALVGVELDVLAVSHPLAELVDRDPREIEGAHERDRHPLGLAAAETMAILHRAGLARGEVAFAEAYDVLRAGRGDQIHVRQLWIPVCNEGGPLFVRVEIGRVDAATLRAVVEQGPRVRVTTRHELEVVPVVEEKAPAAADSDHAGP